MIFGYARVSSHSQSLGEQMEQLINASVAPKNIFKEKFTGTSTERPEFQKLLKQLKENDTLVVTKLDRFARNTKEALEVVEPLMSSNITIKVLNLGTIENTTVGRMILRTLLSVAEMERDMIVERTQEGKLFAKKNNPNFKEGRPKKFKKEQLDLAMERLLYKTTKEVSKETGISEATLYREKRKRKYQNL